MIYIKVFCLWSLLGVLCLMFICVIILNLFLYMVWRNVLIVLHIIPQFSQHHLKKLSLVHYIFLPPLPWINRMHVGLFLGSLFCSTNIHVCFYYSTTLLITAALQPEVWEGTTSSFVFCVSIWILGLFLLVLWKNVMDILMGIAVNL